MFYPSIASHSMNGILIFIGVLFVLFNFKKIRSLDAYHMLIVLLLFSITMGIHGISHLLLESEYQYVPLNLWKLPKKDMNCPCMKMHMK
jgi:hypothetical protein